MAGQCVEIFVVAVAFAHHLELIELAAIHLMEVVHECFNNLVLFRSRHDVCSFLALDQSCIDGLEHVFSVEYQRHR